MSDGTKIEWTDASWNPVRARLRSEPAKVGWHCVHKSEGCRNCYAEAINRRLGTGLPFKPGHERDIEIFLDEKMLLVPLRWRRPRKVFVGSMTDLFADFVSDEMLDRIFAVMALCPQHVFQVLTKRPERMREYMAAIGGGDTERWARALQPLAGLKGALALGDALEYLSRRGPLRNVWLGTSIEDQKAADGRIPHLLATPAAVRFLSGEPLLGPLDLRRVSTFRFRGAEVLNALTGTLEGMFGDYCATRLPPIDWIIVGGESGPGARPMHPDWARSLRDQCAAAGVPFFFNQWGEWAPEASFGRGSVLLSGTRRDLDGTSLWKVGKKAAGRRLDGVEHNGVPA